MLRVGLRFKGRETMVEFDSPPLDVGSTSHSHYTHNRIEIEVNVLSDLSTMSNLREEISTKIQKRNKF